MRRTASEVLRSLEMRVARLEENPFSESDSEKVSEVLLKALFNTDPKEEDWDEDVDLDPYGYDYRASTSLEYRVPFRLIRKLASKALRKEVSRTDLNLFLNRGGIWSKYSEKMDLSRGSSFKELLYLLNVNLDFKGIEHYDFFEQGEYSGVETEIVYDDSHRREIDSEDDVVIDYVIYVESSDGP